MNAQPTHLSPLETKILQALRPAPMETYQLNERYGTNYSNALFKLISKNMVERIQGERVQITEKGRALCPTRRESYV